MHMPPTTSHICAEEQEQGTSAARHVSTLTRSHGQFPTPHRDDDTLLQILIVFTPTALSFGSGHRFTAPDCWKIETSREKIISHWEYIRFLPPLTQLHHLQNGTQPPNVRTIYPAPASVLGQAFFI
ncbi:hypothetical protein FVEG_16093 [Fusarium verticillioides 7600]|uniref:Uncharacterized protein n=1 Tax=Gibberella moniliformis (strain M3125 / FGSC 7600) TaxID=334819 RepID=W7M8C6_GIBM7|nr:hypothetical protein FVEG_16093 [Fusarium verticillioides 7600]EWG47256.1 hypothetical protein FVEG_16093 [Fusarium verticillioides 7600]